MASINPATKTFDTKLAQLLTLSLTTISIFLIILNQIKKVTKKQKQQPLPFPPGPRGLPILGSLLFLNQNLHQYFTNLSKTYGPILSLRLGSKLCVVISSPSAARQIFKHQDHAFANHVVPAAARAYFANSNPDILFSPYGPLWRSLRKITVHNILSTAAIETALPLRRGEMRRAVADLSKNVGEKVNVGETVLLTVLNVMTSMLFGERVGGGSEEKKFMERIREIVDLLMAPNVADYFPVLEIFDPQGIGRRMKKLMGEASEYVNLIVEKRKGGERRGDVLESLLGIVESGDSQPPFDMDDLFKLFVDIVGGAAENISVTVEWAMSELLTNPTKMQKAQQELDAVIGKHRVAEESDNNQLSYLHAVYKETLRLHPAVPLLIPHCPSSNSAVSGFSIPAGTAVLANVWAMQRDPSLWGADAEDFKPERFLKEGKENNNIHELCYMPFGAGRRICVGMGFAERVVIYMLASLLHSFEWHLPDNAPLELREKFGTVLRKAEPLFAVPVLRLDDTKLYV